MLDPVTNGISKLFGWLRTFWDDLWKQVGEFFKGAWGLALIAGSTVWAVLNWATNKVVESYTSLVQIDVGQLAGGTGTGDLFNNDYIGFFNYFLPIEEGLAMFTLWFAAVVAMWTAKHVGEWLWKLVG